MCFHIVQFSGSYFIIFVCEAYNNFVLFHWHTFRKSITAFFSLQAHSMARYIIPCYSKIKFLFFFPFVHCQRTRLILLITNYPLRTFGPKHAVAWIITSLCGKKCVHVEVRLIWPWHVTRSMFSSLFIFHLTLLRTAESLAILFLPTSHAFISCTNVQSLSCQTRSKAKQNFLGVCVRSKAIKHVSFALLTVSRNFTTFTN